MNTNIYPCVSLILKSEGLWMECYFKLLKELKLTLLQLVSTVSSKAVMPILQTSIRLNLGVALQSLLYMFRIPQYLHFLLNKPHQFKSTRSKTPVQCYCSFNGLRMGGLWKSEFFFINLKGKDLMRRKFSNTALFEAASSLYL